MADLTLEAGESQLGAWTTNFLPHGGGRYTGRLVITDRRIAFESKFDTSLGGVLENVMFKDPGGGDFIVIPRERIAGIEAKKGLLNKRVMITLDDGQVHTIDNGAMSVGKILAALEKA